MCVLFIYVKKSVDCMDTVKGQILVTVYLLIYGQSQVAVVYSSLGSKVSQMLLFFI